MEDEKFYGGRGEFVMREEPDLNSMDEELAPKAFAIEENLDSLADEDQKAAHLYLLQGKEDPSRYSNGE